jgi:hypothetical protein
MSSLTRLSVGNFECQLQCRWATDCHRFSGWHGESPGSGEFGAVNGAGCRWSRDYLANNPEAEESERSLCREIVGDR